VDELRAHVGELSDISGEMGLTWLGVGFHPLATQADLPWVPKHRYGVMKRYLPERGARGLDMMRRTATVQANFDYSSEQDAMRKVVVLLRLSPFIHAMTANSPFFEGRVSKHKSERGAVWLEMDPSRSGLIPSLWEKEHPRYSDYVEWALDAGMFLFKRPSGFIHNTGQTFRSFLVNGFEGHRATFADWALHLNTLFPEARLKRTIEGRACDCLPLHLTGAVPALFTGILYDAKSLDRAEALSRRFEYETVVRARPRLIAEGLATSVGGVAVRQIAEEIMEIARDGLSRRRRLDSAAQDETIHLAELGELIAGGRAPADRLLEGLTPGQVLERAEVVSRCKL
jgi:glutamate--cysteine ligase